MVGIKKTKKIAIVDDEEDVRFLLREALTKEKYNVYVAENGLKLISVLRSENIDCILLDVNMPWLSGFQICKSIKNDENLKHIKIVYISGFIKDEKECYETGCDAIIKKPFRIRGPHQQNK